MFETVSATETCLIILFVLGIVALHGGRATVKIRGDAAAATAAALDVSLRLDGLERAIRELAVISEETESEDDDRSRDPLEDLGAVGGERQHLESTRASPRSEEDALIATLAAQRRAVTASLRKYILVRISPPRVETAAADGGVEQHDSAINDTTYRSINETE